VFIYGFNGQISEFFPESLMLIKTFVALFDIVIIFYGMSFINKKYKNMRFSRHFRILSFIFLLIAASTFLVNFNEISLLHHLNGLREGLLLFAFFFILQNEFEKDFLSLIIWYKKVIILFLFLQIPFSVNQFLIHGAGDAVGGSFGTGGSGILTQIIFINLFLLFVIDKYFLFKKYNVLYLLFLVPVFINETKISLVFLLIYFVCVAFVEGKIKGLVFVGIFIFMFIIFGIVYTVTTGLSDFNLLFSSNFVEDYLYSQNIYQNDVSRFTRLVISYQYIITKDISTFLFGIGYGLNKGGTVISKVSGINSILYLIKGSRILLQMQFLQGGIFLVIVYVLINFYYLIVLPLKVIIKYLFIFLFFSIMFFIGWFYNDGLASNQFFMFNSTLIILFLTQFASLRNEC